MKALVVDDAIFMRRMISGLTSQLGYEIIEAENGEEAVALAKAELPDIIVMDIVMPKMDGITAMKMIKSERDVKVILCSSLIDKKQIKEAINAGADNYIPKPISKTDFIKVLTETSRII